jgi:hypothetical protein
MSQLTPIPEDEADQLPTSNEAPTSPTHPFGDTDNPMPLSAMPQPMCDYVQAISAQNGLSAEMCAATTLGVLSAAMGAGIWMESGRNLKLAGNLYIVMSARSGTGKSVAFRQIAGRLNSAQSAMIKEWSVRKEANSDDATPWPGFIFTNATSEALAKALEVNPGCAAALLTPDARGAIDIIFGRYTKGGSMDLDLYLNAWSYDNLTYARRQTGCYVVQSPCLSLFFAVQPDKMADFCAAPEFLDSGMAARILMLRVPQKSEEGEEGEGAPAEVLEWWDQTVDAALHLRGNADSAPVIRLSPEARRVRDGIKQKQEKLLRAGRIPALDAVVCRWAEQAMRLALVFHVARHGEKVSDHELGAEDMEGGGTLAEWFLAQAASLLSPVTLAQNDKLRRRALDAFERRKSHEITVRLLKNSHGLDRDDLERLVATFPEEFRLQVRLKESGAGRPSEVFQKISG